MAAQLITQLSLPTVIDVTDGKQFGTFAITLAQGALGPGTHVELTFENVFFGVDIGADGGAVDTFADGTPNYASSRLEFDGNQPAGEYAIRSLFLWDDAGHGAVYSAAQLRALGFQTSFTVIDHRAPAAPTVIVDAGAGGLVDGNHVVAHGTAAPGDLVLVSYRDPVFGLIPLPDSVTADAEGHWSMTSDELDDGHYTQLVAIAYDGEGHPSAYSAPLDFIIQKAPDTAIQLAHGADGTVNTAKPLIWGVTTANSSVTLYDGGQAVTTVQADKDGWWGILPGTLAAGTHHLAAQVQDQFGRVSPMSAPLDVRVAAPSAGISFTVASLSNSTSQAFDASKLQAALDAVAGLISGVLDGAQDIALAVTIADAGTSNAIAASGSTFHSAAGSSAMPTISDGRLYLSPDFAKAISDAKSLTTYAVEVLAHEMLHVLGIAPAPGSAFAAQIKTVGEDAYFYGFSAMALNGGPVLLSHDQAHVGEYGDLMYPSHSEYVRYFWPDDADAPYSQLDLSILKALGYHNKDTLVSTDGHRYLPGNGTAGHDTVKGVAGIDTLYIDGTTTAHAVKATAGGFDVLDKAGNGGTLKLSAIERIYFNDKAVALDVGAGEIGGMVYRMYQAAFNRTPDSVGLGYWIDSMGRGTTLNTVAHEFKASPEFAKLYGATLSDSDFLTQLYANVLHRAPDADGKAYWLDQMKHGQLQEEVLANFSESAENVAQLVGVLQNGFSYDYYRQAA